jgi:hypothetical protein
VSFIEQEIRYSWALCRESNGKQEISVVCVVPYKWNRKCLDSVLWFKWEMEAVGCVSFVTLERRNFFICQENIGGRDEFYKDGLWDLLSCILIDTFSSLRETLCLQHYVVHIRRWKKQYVPINKRTRNITLHSFISHKTVICVVIAVKVLNLTDLLTDRYSFFKVCKSVHRHTIQINQLSRCNNFSSNKLVKLLRLVGWFIWIDIRILF